MRKILIIVALIIWVSLCGTGSLKRIAKIDSINFDLKANETKAWTQALTKNMNLSFMANLELNEKQTKFKEFQIEMKNKKNKIVKCTFKYVTNLCVLEESTQQVSMKIKCFQQNCSFKLILSQRVIYHFDGVNNHKSKMLTVPGEIYKLQKQKFNSLIQIHMEKRQEKLLQGDITVYSNVHAFGLSQIQQLTTNNLIFGLKPIIENNDRYIYIEGDQNIKNKQLRANIITHQGTLNQGISIVDFIQTYGHHSRNIYDYSGTFTKNIQIKARVFAPKLNSDLPFSIVVTGKNKITQNATQISTLQISPIDFQGHSFHDITFLIAKSQYSKFSIINFEVAMKKIEDRAVFIQLQVSDVAISDIFIFDDVYFSADQKQKLYFLITPQVKYQILGQDKQIAILTQNKYAVSNQSCSLHKGCQLFIKTDSKCEACHFKFDLQDEDIKNHIIYYQVKNSSIQAKIDFEEELYFKYEVQSHSHTQIVVNNPNVMVYANFDGYPRCNIPSANCHQFVINQQNPIIASNKLNQSQTLIVNVVGLQKTTFSLRFLDKLAQIKISLGEKFSYLFDDEEQQITVFFNTNNLTFTKQVQHLSFNLISPINSLMLTVKNVGGEIMKSNDGYIEFPRDRVRGEQFEIKINKIGMFIKQFVHMTLIVTTADQGITLDSTTTHYQKYLPGAQHKFYMEYDPSQQSSLNIYTEGLERSQSKMKLIIKDINLEQTEQQKKPFIEKALLRDNQVIDLDFQLQNLDICEQINCQLEIIITSYSTEQLQQSLTLIHGESVILLEDSIWNSFEINPLSKNNHFYYIPRVQNKSINILFNTQDRNLFIDYTIHNTYKSVNPQDWPWDHHSSVNKEEITSHITGFQSYKIAADDPYLQDCWPSCVVLISVLQSNREVSTRFEQPSRQLIKTYKILASSTIVQAPEDVKFQIVMQNKEQNSMFVQIKNFLKAEEFTFFLEYKVGRARVVANLFNKGIEYKIKSDKKDFVFEDVETHLPISTITNALNRYSLKAEETTLKITFYALTSVNLYFEFTSELKSFYRLNMDDLEVVTLRQGEEIWYQYIPERDFSIKFYRTKGFPMFKVFQCKEEGYVECLTKNKNTIETQLKEKLTIRQRTKQDMENVESNLVIDNNRQKKDLQPLSQKSKQVLPKNELQIFVDKNYEYSNEQCENCMIFIWIYSFAQDLQMSINIRSSSSEIELKEMAVINDRIQQQQKHLKYLINVQPGMLAIITFRIIEGVCRVSVSDSNNQLFNSTYNQIDNDYEDIKIPELGLPQQSQQEESPSQNLQNQIPNIPNVVKATPKTAKHHVFRHLHVKVTSLSQKPIQYLISYSIGFNGVFLEDGVVTQKELVPDVPQSYFYHNKDKNSHAYFSLSSSVTPGFDAQHSKNNIEVRFFYYPDSNNRDNKEEFKPQMPPKKNQNFFGSTITHVYQLPSKFQLYQIELFSKNYLNIITSINHKQIVYLPLGYEYLIKLHANQSIYLVVDRPKTEYLELSIKKCDTSVPTLYYTNDAKQFQTGIYQSKQQILGSFQRKLIKTKKNSKTIHFKVVAQEYSETLFSITVVPEIDSRGANSKKIRPGNNGLLSYTSIATNKIQIQFSPIVCQGKNCVVPPAQYYLLLAKSMDNIYGQLNCAGNYIISQAQKLLNSQSQLIEITGSHYDQQAKVYRYILTLESQQQFIGVKANFIVNNKKTDVLYMPTEITSLWKQLTNMSIGIVLIVSFALAVILSLAVIISAKLARRGYRPIAESQ